MRKCIRVSVISFSLALIIMISDGIINLQGFEYIDVGDVVSVVFYSQIMGLGLYFILRMVDILFLDRKNIDSSSTRIRTYLIVSICFIALFVFTYTKLFVNGLPMEEQDNEAYIISKYATALVAGYLYLVYGVVLFLVIEWVNNKVKVKKFHGKSKLLNSSQKDKLSI